MIGIDTTSISLANGAARFVLKADRIVKNYGGHQPSKAAGARGKAPSK